MGARPEHAGLGTAHRLKVKDRATLLEYRAHLEANGVEVLGVTDHGAFHSIYFFDPNGHRVELACPDPDEAETLRKLDAVISGTCSRSGRRPSGRRSTPPSCTSANSSTDGDACGAPPPGADRAPR